MYAVPPNPPARRQRLRAAGTHRLFSAKHLSAHRRLHVLDLENLCGTGHLTSSLIEYVIDAYREDVGIDPSDLVVIGVSHHNMLTAGIAIPAARLCVQSGTDGADLALLDVLTDDATTGRFAGVCIGSGDGIFADIAAAVAAAGVDVVIAKGLSGTSRRLRMAARHLVQLTFTAYTTQEHA